MEKIEPGLRYATLLLTHYKAVYPLPYHLAAYDIRGRQTLAFSAELCPQISYIPELQGYSSQCP